MRRARLRRLHDSVLVLVLVQDAALRKRPNQASVRPPLRSRRNRPLLLNTDVSVDAAETRYSNAYLLKIRTKGRCLFHVFVPSHPIVLGLRLAPAAHPCSRDLIMPYQAFRAVTTTTIVVSNPPKERSISTHQDPVNSKLSSVPCSTSPFDNPVFDPANFL